MARYKPKKRSDRRRTTRIEVSNVSFIDKVFQAWYYILGFLAGIMLFYFGKSRISLGISSIRVSDPYTAHFMSKGLLYLQLSLLILVVVSISITMILAKSNVTYITETKKSK